MVEKVSALVELILGLELGVERAGLACLELGYESKESKLRLP